MVWHDDPERGAQLAADAGAIFGGGVLLALQDMQAEGRLPAPGTPAWDDFAAAAEAGDVERAIVVLVRDRVARRFGHAAPVPAKPVSLADDLHRNTPPGRASRAGCLFSASGSLLRSLAAPPASAAGRGLGRLGLLAHPGELGPHGVKLPLGTLGAAAQLAARLLEHLGA